MNTANGNAVEAKEQPVTSNGNGHKPPFDILKEAVDQGVADTYRDVARKLRVSTATLSNLVHGRSNASPRTRRKIEQLFGKPLEKLGDGTAPTLPIKRPGRPGRKPGTKMKAAKAVMVPEVKGMEITASDAFKIAVQFNPALRSLAKATLQKALDELSGS